MIPRGERSDEIVEPLLTDQWYVRMKPLAAPAIEAVEQGRIRFVPENWTKTYFDWMHNIHDWCISRQLWWGHRIPAWYDDAGNDYVARDEADAAAAIRPRRRTARCARTRTCSTPGSRRRCGLSRRSAGRTHEDSRTSTRPRARHGLRHHFLLGRAHDHVGLKFAGDVPFRDVYIHALDSRSEGQKMSKTKGTSGPARSDRRRRPRDAAQEAHDGLMQPSLQGAIERATRKEFPDGITAFGTDALRMTFASLARRRDVRFDLARADGHHRFCNKLWNASAYVLSQLEGDGAGARSSARGPLDTVAPVRRDSRSACGLRGLSARRRRIRRSTTLARQRALANWYLELTKAVLTDAGADPALRRGSAAHARSTCSAAC